MATCSSVLAWESPWTKEPGRLQSLELQRVRNYSATEHAHVGVQCKCVKYTHELVILTLSNFFPHLWKGEDNTCLKEFIQGLNKVINRVPGPFGGAL